MDLMVDLVESERKVVVIVVVVLVIAGGVVARYSGVLRCGYSR